MNIEPNLNFTSSYKKVYTQKKKCFSSTYHSEDEKVGKNLQKILTKSKETSVIRVIISRKPNSKWKRLRHRLQISLLILSDIFDIITSVSPENIRKPTISGNRS